MTWTHDQLAPADALLFRSALTKIGCFNCHADDPEFTRTENLNNDVFVLPANPLWIRRNDTEYRFVEPGGILLHRAGSSLERRPVNAQGDLTYWFAIHPDLFVETLDRHRLPIHEMGASQVVTSQLRCHLALLTRDFQQGDTFHGETRIEERAKDCAEEWAEETILDAFFTICEQRVTLATGDSRSGERTRSRQRRIVDKAKAYLSDNLAEAASLQDIAEYSGASVYHLCRLFKQETGLLLSEYRIRQRLGRVIDRLLHSDTKGLTELALDSGFSSHSHLSRVFQKQTGQSPSAFRKAVRKQARATQKYNPGAVTPSTLH